MCGVSLQVRHSCHLLFYTVCIVFIHIAYPTMAQEKGKLPTNNRGLAFRMVRSSQARAAAAAASAAAPSIPLL